MCLLSLPRTQTCGSHARHPSLCVASSDSLSPIYTIGAAWSQSPEWGDDAARSPLPQKITPPHFVVSPGRDPVYLSNSGPIFCPDRLPRVFLSSPGIQLPCDSDHAECSLVCLTDHEISRHRSSVALTAGSPSQRWSPRGRGLGLEDPRDQLMVSLALALALKLQSLALALASDAKSLALALASQSNLTFLGFGLESKIATSTSDLAQLSCVAIA